MNDNAESKTPITYINTAKKRVILTFLFIFACHYIVFLAFYPGLCTYDMDAQIKQYINHDFCTSHPLIHTLLLGFFHDLFDSPNTGYAIATILQMCIVDSAITYAMTYVYNRNKNNILYVISLVFYSIFPIVPLLTISHTKDVLFAAFALIFFIDCVRLLDSNIGKNKYLFYTRIVVNGILMNLFRNNSIHAFIIYTIFILTLYIARTIHRKNTQALKHMISIAVAILIVSIVSSKALFIITGSTKGSIKEMMSIPAQIMGYVYNNSANEDEKELILSYIPNPEEYNYYLSDPMKKNLPFEIWESKCKHFLLDSTIIALHHPLDAVYATMRNIQGYFDPIHCPYSSDHFYLARHDYRGDAEQVSKLPALCNIYVDYLYTSESISHTPFVAFFNMGLYVWIVIISFIGTLLPKNKSTHSIAYIFPLLYLCTLLLGPGAIIRYGFLYILMAPVATFNNLLTEYTD